MKSKRTLLFLFAAVLALAAPAVADVRLKVSNKSLGGNRSGDTRSSQRQLAIEIDNRDRESYQGVTVEWTIIARDIKNRKLSIAGVGSRQVDIPAEDEMEVLSDPFSFSRKEGEITRINENRPDLQQWKVDPDSGTRYAGYIVVVRKGDEIIAESATAGMQRRVKGLKPPKKD